MANLVPVAGSVKKLTNNVQTLSQKVSEGVTISPGDLIIKGPDGAVLAVNDTIQSADLNKSRSGIAVSGGVSEKNVDFVDRAGTEIELGISVTPNEWFAVSATGGKIAPLGDLSSGQAVQYVGYGNKEGKFVYYPVKTNETLT
jgi:hypothetical protein